MRDVPSFERPAMRIVSGPEIVGGCRLHTATLSLVEADGSVLQVFHACRVVRSSEVVARLAARLGAPMAGAATVRVGLDPTDPLVASLIGADAAQRLHADGDLPGGALRGGGDLHIMQRRG